MTHPRTPTPKMDEIWSDHARIDRWHQHWIGHLRAQIDANPNHPAARNGDIKRYVAAADQFLETGEVLPGLEWLEAVRKAEETTRHDLVAALQVFNRVADAQTAHLGLTSHDIVDAANQEAIRDSLEVVIGLAFALAGELAKTACVWREQPIVARTHGQPAQLTTYGHRIATVLGPLLDWVERASTALNSYSSRPPYGAVGTGADLQRVLNGWQQAPADQCEATIGHLGRRCSLPAGHPVTGIFPHGHSFKWLHQGNRSVERYALIAGESPVMLVTRQTYHRSYDLHIAAILAEFASVAQTWATDRRLEALLGLGNEVRDPEQVGSSAMAHKTNPILCERIVSLCAVSRGCLSTAAELAGGEWLEGDVSGSAGRRHWLPAMFRSTEAILVNWAEANRRWEPDTDAMTQGVKRSVVPLASGAILQLLVEHGIDRERAHVAVKAASVFDDLVPPGYTQFGTTLAGTPIAREAGLTAEQIADAVRAATRLPVGNVEEQIAAVLLRVPR